MSHFKERIEKNCLNCNAEVAGKYCQVCGQENIVPKETFWHLITHFFNDITHFDGKFFTTTKLLLLKPGFLPAEYLRGRRSSYLHPIRMYVFTSAIFFLIFFAVTDDAVNFREQSSTRQKKIANQIKMDGLDSMIADSQDSTIISALSQKKYQYKTANRAIDSAADAEDEAENAAAEKKTQKPTKVSGKIGFQIPSADSILQAAKDSSKNADKNHIIGFTADYPDSVKTPAQYERYQLSLPEKKRDNWLVKKLSIKDLSIREKYRYKDNEFSALVVEKFLHSFPKMLFVSLPLFALVLQLLYCRRKDFYYTDHAVFSMYHFIAVFIILAMTIVLNKLKDVTGWQIFGYLETPLLLYTLFYLYKSMRNFYGQRRGKTILKFILLCIISSFITILLTLIFLLLTFLKV